MTRICGACKKSLGEKCGQCGNSNPTLLYEGHYYCPECEAKWIKGQQPETTGLCEDCLGRQVSELTERAS